MKKDRDITEIIKLMAHEIAQPSKDIEELAGCYRLIVKCCGHELGKIESKEALIRWYHQEMRNNSNSKNTPVGGGAKND